MSVQEPPAPAPPQERATSPLNSLGDAPTTNPLPVKKTGSKKTSKRKTSKRTKTVEPVDPPAPQRARYEPYRRAEPTPERDAILPADPDELETLDATAKKLYKSDREVLEYVESLKRRTAAMLEHVNRTDSQLRAYKGAMGRIGLYMDQWQKMEDRWTHQERFGNGNFRARWVDGRMEVLESDESSDDEDDEGNIPNPDLFPTLIRNENGGFPTVEEHLFKNVDHPDFPHDYARDYLGDSAPLRPSNDDNEEEDFTRPETPPARQPSLPPGHEDENVLEYAEDEIEIRSDYPAPPDHASLASDDPTFDRSEVDLRVASDTDLPFPRSGEESAKISKRFKREAMDFAAALAARPHNNLPRPRHPLAQSYVPSSPDPAPQPELQHLVAPHPVPRTPSPPHPAFVGKRKRASTPEEEDGDFGNASGPSTVVARPGVGVPRPVEARNDEDRASPKKRRLISRQQTWDFQMFSEAGAVPSPPQANPPTRENSPEPSSQPAHRQASPPPIPTSQVQKEDSELERSQVMEMLSQEVEQGESEDEESTENILGCLGKSRSSLPALTADNTQSTAGANTQSEVRTPAESQVPAEVPISIPEDVFGPIVLSAKAKKISATFEKDDDGDVVMSDSGHSKISSKSTRFSFDGNAEKGEHKVFRKTPMRPRASLRTTEAERALAAQVEAESQDVANPLRSPKKKRVVGARARKPKSTASIEAEPAVNPDDGLLSASTSKPPSRLRRGRSTSVQPEVPALPKTPARRPTRNRK